MCERLYKKIKSIECESNLYISNNKVLFETIYNLIKEGVPIPSAYYINDHIVDKETERYVLTKYIYDVDDIIYKVEAHSKIKLEKSVNLRVKFIEKEYLKDYEVEDFYKEDKYNILDSLQIYVSHNHFEKIWNESTIPYFLSCYHDEENFKIHTHILEKDEFGYDLQIELYEIPDNPIKTFLVANHLSKIREALQCGPLMHFFLTKTNIQENSFEKFIIRKNEVIFILKKNDYLLAVISIHYEDEYDKYIVLGLCKNIHLTTKTMDLTGNLDCSFYTDFPSHLITPEFFVYNNLDRDNYEKEKSYLSWSNNSSHIKNTYKFNENHFKKEDKEKIDEQIKEKLDNEEQEDNKNNTDTEKKCNNFIDKKKNNKEYICDDKSGDISDNQICEEKEMKVPNVGFISLRMDTQLFNNCRDFSELIQISSRISHIIVSFRDFLNNSLVLYRIKQRRTF
ncbi:conserved Plasmodium protein, unknown function [Plasmodium gallinaceum]|uniref:Arp2/3 complex 34 kDa subunit n=1 Tax=Plasmodium gallinaceum TaxID=5849 RepID=A0A1J1GU43_PLAGA|nr:conserved Plasmodium protein, unknown function [Plasmodium gallinaceum]CRG95809.1 conserved Plasmodium protein, unknown function [Plasmodium gallinaceum]